MSKDAIFSEIKRLNEELQGISPKLQIYKDIEKKIKELKAKVGGQGHQVERTAKRPAVLYPKNARFN